MDIVNTTHVNSNSPLEPNIWRERYQIRSYEVDSGGRLSILSLFSFMQEAASKHAEALGVSIQQLLAENCTWLLARLKVTIDSYPGWKDRIQVDTWPSGAQRLFALRDFELKNAGDQTFAKAISAWLVLDIAKRRPMRIAAFVDRLKPLEGDHILTEPLDKLPALANPTYDRKFLVRHRDLDINRHVNNVSFVEWAVESVPSAVLNTSVPAEFEINFLAEAFYGDSILAACQRQAQPGTVFGHSLIREADAQELVRARTVWQRVETVKQ